MDIAQTEECNKWNLLSLSKYLSVDANCFLEYYNELRSDQKLINGLNERLAFVKTNYNFSKAIFKKDKIDTIDWFAFERVLIYVLTRHFKPMVCLETGVYYGGNTAFVLAGLAKNKCGKLISIDLPDSKIRMLEKPTSRHPLVGDSENYDKNIQPGFIIPEYLKERWIFVEGDSHKKIPQISEKIDFYIHDSDHSYEFLLKEMEFVRPKLSEEGIVLVDDIDWSNGFYAYCVKNNKYPMLFTDNGKDNLRVRMGLIQNNNKNNSVFEITGFENRKGNGN